MSDAIRDARRLEASAGVRAMDDAVLRVSGDGARTWLNGQITNDVRRTEPGDAVYALSVDVRGRIVSDLRVFDRGDTLLVVVPADRRDRLLAHLGGYLVMEDVDLAVAEGLRVISVQGPRAAEVTEGHERFLCDRLGGGGFDVLVDAPSAERVRTELIERASALGGGEVGPEGWELERVRAGVPALDRDFGADTYPQEAGLKHTAVSFEKGCYLGQEVVCMLENRGQLRRRLVRLEGEADAAPGDELRRDGVAVGKVTSAVRDPEDGRLRALGYVKRSVAEPGHTVDGTAGALAIIGVVGDPTGDGGERGL
jgi:folate-binding protein YgfZ